jgi:chitosanase
VESALKIAETGHLTFGRSQASLASGNLSSIVRAYCAAPGARFSAELSAYMDRLDRRDVSLDSDMALRSLLQESATDPVMRTTQDDFFDRAFFAPAMRAAEGNRVTTPLGQAVVYDSFIQGGWNRARTLTLGKISPSATEADWIRCYVSTRRQWLASCPAPLPATVYRMDAFSEIIAAGKWQLELPLRVRGVVIDEAALAGTATARVLRLTSPLMRGDDVSALQRSLKDHGFVCALDGVFGPNTEQAVRAFQMANALEADGIAGPDTIDALGMLEPAIQ